MSGWLVIEDWNEDPPLQVVPETDSSWYAHVLHDECWCRPYRDTVAPLLLIHREAGQA